jgi:PAS domain-containing protein
VFLWRLFWASPILALALSICLATILWCILIIHRRQKGPDRFLAALIGVVCNFQGQRLLRQAGLISQPGSHAVDVFADLMVTGLYLVSVVILKISMRARKSAEVRLRLVEANDQPAIPRVASLENPERSVSTIILESNPFATISVDPSGKVTYWNPAAERLLGWTSNEVVGKASPLLLSRPIRTRAGVLVRSESWASALHDSAGRPCGTLLVIAPPAADQQREAQRVAMSEAKPTFGVKHLAPVAGA